jgi:hypothetical protein
VIKKRGELRKTSIYITHKKNKDCHWTKKLRRTTTKVSMKKILHSRLKVCNRFIFLLLTYEVMPISG